MSTLFETPAPEPPVTAAEGGRPGTTTEGEAVVVPGPSLYIHVLGTPAPQGSKRAFVNRHTGRASVVESSSKVKPWREAVKSAATDAVEHRARIGDPFATISGPASVHVTFLLARPKGHFRTGRNAHLLRDSAPEFPITKPDTDKLLRSTLDALTDVGVYGDDCQIVHVSARKVYADGDLPGAHIRVYGYGGQA